MKGDEEERKEVLGWCGDRKTREGAGDGAGRKRTLPGRSDSADF